MHSVFVSVLIKSLKRSSRFTAQAIEPEDSLYVPLLSESEGDIPTPSPSQLPSLEQAHSSAFDLSLTRYSLLVYLVFFGVMGLASNPTVFTISSMFSQFGAGYLPGLHSMAMEMYVLRERRIRGGAESGLIPVEVGKLYGSLAVMQALL